MKPPISESSVLIWRIADLHARELHAESIEPHHIMLALTKCVDLDLTKLVPKDAANHDDLLEQLLREVRRIRTIFRGGKFDAQAFRRRLRKLAPAARFGVGDDKMLHRSDATRKLFREAQQSAALAGQTVFPVHLLFAALFTNDPLVDEVMKEMEVDRELLQALAKREVFPKKAKGFFSAGGSKLGRN